MFDDFNDYNFQNKLKVISYNEIYKYNKTLKNDMCNTLSGLYVIVNEIHKKNWIKIFIIWKLCCKKCIITNIY